MRKPIHFTKEYERDVSLVVEGFWLQRLPISMSKRLGITPPDEPFSVFYATDENLQIWENKHAIEWYRDRLLEESKKGPAFIEKIISEYEPLLAQIKEYWKAGPTVDRNRLEKYKSLLGPAVELFSLWYYVVSDERTPKDIKERLTTLRSEDGFFGFNDVFIKGCVELAGVRPELAILIFPSEFPDIPESSVLERRSHGVVSTDGSSYSTISIEKFAAEHPEYYFEGLGESVSSVNEFKGQIAFKGKVVGKVRIVKNKFQMRDVGEGDILVSPMTTPDFLPAMEKAAAFVTNEGGIICHAAIVAREMKKPCIIGTKIATKVLKDGDMVEVDADKGIVRIIK